MAELASSVITLANAALVTIDVTVRYIKEVNFVNELIQDLLSKLKDLHRLIRTVASTYKRADTGDDNPSYRFVGRTLMTCQDRLERLKPMVFELASLESETWMQKLAVKRQSDKVKKEIHTTVQNIHCDMEYIRTGLSCWSLEEQRAIRRISEAMAERQALNIRVGLQDTLDSTVMPMKRTLSEAMTVVDQDADLSLRRTSTTLSIVSQPSIASSSSSYMPTSPSARSNSFASSPDSQGAQNKADWEEFHFHIARCGSDGSYTRKIRDILQKHSNATSLAKSPDTWDRTPLHVAAQRDDVELARILLDFGADINAKDSEPSSVLDFAVASKSRNFVAFLIANGVNEKEIRTQNAAKFKEMKRTILFEKKAALKKRGSLSQSTQPGHLV